MRSAVLLLAAFGAAFAVAAVPQSSKVDQKEKELVELRLRADKAAARLADVAKAGNVTSDEAVKALQEAVAELKAINEKLKAIQADLDALKAGAKTTAAKVEQHDRQGLSIWSQIAFSDTEEGPNSLGGRNRTNNDAFNLRRIRLGITQKIAPDLNSRTSVELSSGAQREVPDVRDAYLRWTPSSTPWQVTAGQQNMTLGADIGRSSVEREFIERSLYNRTFFNGERGRGVDVQYKLTPTLTANAGVWNSLSIFDPQATDANRFGNLSGTRMALMAGLKHKGGNYELGVSGMLGRRTGTSARTITSWTDSNGNGQVDGGEVTNTNVPATAANERRFLYLDGMWQATSALSFRGEFMTGYDRVPTLSNGVPVATTASSVMGYQMLARYQFDPKNSLSARFEALDPDTGAPSNTTSAFGLVYMHDFNSSVRLALAHEWWREQPFNSRNNVWNLRVQFRYK